LNVLTADGSLQNLLRGVVQPTEIRDPSGRIMGYYTPVHSPEEAEVYAKVAGLFDLEEARRVLQTQRDQGRTLEEIMRDLRSSENRG
jgi:hypothetical protein